MWKRLLTLIGSTLLLAWAASAAVAQAQTAPAAWGELVMFEREGCVWCAQWDREIAPIYPKTDEARLFPLRRFDLDSRQPSPVALAQPVHFTPTFVLVVCGKERGRITGYPGEDNFWGLLGEQIKLLQAAQKTASC